MIIFYTHLVNKKLEKHVFWIKLLHLLDLKKTNNLKALLVQEGTEEFHVKVKDKAQDRR